MPLRLIAKPHWKAYLKNISTPLRIINWQHVITDHVWYSDINWVIMDYLISEGYPGAAEKFAQETNMSNAADLDSIRERVAVRNSIHAGDIDAAIQLINEIDPELKTLQVEFSADSRIRQILDSNHLLHFHLLQLQLIEIIRGILAKPSGPAAKDFLPALQFATEQLAPRAPTSPIYQEALERTMALMILPSEKMAPEFKELLDERLRESVGGDVNKAILESRGERSEAKIRQLIRARAWAEAEARSAKVNVPAYVPIGLDVADEMVGTSGTLDADAMVS